jgi:hypothetical protein
MHCLNSRGLKWIKQLQGVKENIPNLSETAILGSFLHYSFDGQLQWICLLYNPDPPNSVHGVMLCMFYLCF